VSFSHDLGSSRPPVYFTRFVGRFAQIRVLHEFLAAPTSCRLITLVGSGGSGKTRLAAEMVSSASSGGPSSGLIPDDIGWVDLAGLSDGNQLPHVVATAVGMPHGRGDDLTRALSRFLGTRPQLVVLDSCEDLLADLRRLVEVLLAACPRLVFLATSRVRLRSPLERVVQLRPLSVGSTAGSPERPDTTVPTEAAELFLDRAAVAAPMAVERDLEPTMVDAICRRVGGSPLAIELVASWVDRHSTADLLAALANSGTAAGPRTGRNIRVAAVVNAVWWWLDPQEQRVLRGLGSFAGDFTRESAERVADADLAALDALTRRCLIARIADLDDATRYRMHPLVRRHAVRTLERDRTESGTVRRRHFDYCLRLAQAPPRGQGDHHELLHPGVQAEYEAALEWGRATGEVEAVLRLLTALHRYEARWNTPARFLAVLEAELARPQDLPQPMSEARAGTLEAAGWAAADCGDHELAGRRFAEAATAYLRLDGRKRQAASLRGQARAHLMRREMRAATLRLRESLGICRRVADLAGAAWCALYLAEVASGQGDPDAATRQLSVTIKDFERLDVPLGAYCGYVRLGGDQLAIGRLPEALDAYAQGLALGRRWEFVIDMCDLLTGLAMVAAELHRPVRAATLLGAGRAWADAFGRSSLSCARGARVECECKVENQIGYEHFTAAMAAGLGLDAGGARAKAELAVQEEASICRRLLLGVTEREIEVLRLVAEGLTNAEIAERLELSPRTVHAHLRSVYGKLGVNARTAAVRQAASVGLI
jgi:predicted ATPase/DNA-binding CsgD family transcriptional regulator